MDPTRDPRMVFFIRDPIRIPIRVPTKPFMSCLEQLQFVPPGRNVGDCEVGRQAYTALSLQPQQSKVDFTRNTCFQLGPLQAAKTPPHDSEPAVLAKLKLSAPNVTCMNLVRT